MTDRAPTQFVLEDGVDRCPTCGRFVLIEDAYGDVEPGKVRGIDYLASFCNEACAASNECAHGVRGDDLLCSECPS